MKLIKLEQVDTYAWVAIRDDEGEWSASIVPGLFDDNGFSKRAINSSATKRKEDTK